MRSVNWLCVAAIVLVSVASGAHSQVPPSLFPTDTVPYSGCYAPRCFENVLALDQGTAIAGLRPLVTVSIRGPIGWITQQDIYNPDIRPPRNYQEGERRTWPPFATALGLSGDELLIAGSSSKYNFKDVVYVFARANGLWMHTQALALLRPSGFEQTIVSHIAVDGDIALVTGTRYDDEDPSAAFVQVDCYVRTAPGRWARRGSFKPPVGSSEEFGAAIDLSGRFAIFGDPAAQGTGRAYLFEYTNGSWLRRSTLAPPSSSIGTRFGAHVAISGNNAAVAAPAEPTNNSYQLGAVYLFSRDSTTWRRERIIFEPALNEAPEYPDDIRIFGSSLSMDGPRLIVGAQGGVFLAFEPQAYLVEARSGWSVVGGLNNGAGLHSGRVFVSGPTAVVEGAEDWGDRAGYVFELPLIGQLP